jgi:MFS family permease
VPYRASLSVGAFAIGLGPIFWLLITEIYPLRVRGLAMGVATTANWAANLVVSLTFLSLTEAPGPSVTFWVYGLFTVVAVIFSYKLVPETKGRTLEEIEDFWHEHAQAPEARPIQIPARTRASSSAPFILPHCWSTSVLKRNCFCGIWRRAAAQHRSSGLAEAIQVGDVKGEFMSDIGRLLLMPATAGGPDDRIS